MRRRVNGRYKTIKRGNVIAPSADNVRAKTIAGDSLTQELIRTKVDKRTFSNKGVEIKPRKRKQDYKAWHNGRLTERDRQLISKGTIYNG